MSQRLWMRVGEELRGSFASFKRAAKRSSGGTDISSALAFSAARLPAYCAAIFSRFLFRLIWLSLAIGLFAPSALVHERHAETFEKRLGFRVGPRRGLKDDVHPPNRFGLVVIDLDKDDVLLETHRVIASSVEALARYAAEVAHPGQGHRDQAIEKFIHAIFAQRDLDADRAARGDLEVRDRLLRTRDDRLLAGNRGEVVLRALNLLGIGGAFAGADIQHDLLDPRRLQLVGVAELLHQLGAHGFEIVLLVTRHIIGIARGFAHRRSLALGLRGLFLLCSLGLGGAGALLGRLGLLGLFWGSR